jgi:multidrug resistance efflux pump
MVIGLAALAGMVFGMLSRGKASQAAPPQRRQPILVAANGVTEGARPEVLVRPEVTGTIRRIEARENRDVKAGAVLVELENEVQCAQLEQAEADLAMARAELDRLRNGERLLRRESSAALARAREKAYQLSVDAWQRARDARYGISDQDRQRATFLMQQAKDEWEMAKKEQELVDSPPRAEDMAKATAAVRRAEAQRRRAQADLEKTRLRAPFASRVLKVQAEVGQLVGPASPQPLLVVADLSKYRVRAFVEDLDAFKVQRGQRATVTADGWPDHEFVGQVVEVLPSMGRRTVESNQPGEYKDVYYREALIDLEAGEELPLNYRVRVWIEIGVSEPKP